MSSVYLESWFSWFEGRGLQKARIYIRRWWLDRRKSNEQNLKFWANILFEWYHCNSFINATTGFTQSFSEHHSFCCRNTCLNSTFNTIEKRQGTLFWRCYCWHGTVSSEKWKKGFLLTVLYATTLLVINLLFHNVWPFFNFMK